MRQLREWIMRIGGLFNKRRKDEELDEEIQSHLELHVEENLQAGMTPLEARQAAMRKLGGIESMKEAYRDQRGLPWLETLWGDIHYGARQLRKNPGFTAAAVFTLALGVGACTAIFSLINATLLRTLPFPNSDRLVVIWADNPGLKLGTSQIPPANADIAAWRAQSQTLGKVSAFSPRSADLTDGGDADRVGAAGVTAGFFEALGVTPVLGRTITAEEDQPGAPPVLLIGYGLWQRRFGGDPGLLGQSITVNGERRTVIGILPPEFDFPRGAEWPAFFPFSGRTEVWLPLALRAHNDGTGWSNWESRDERGLVMIGRLGPGARMNQVQAEMDIFSARQAGDHPETHKGWALKVVPLRNQLAGKNQTALVTLFAAAGLLLFIACVNVANLLLVRGVARGQEMGIRAALGAARGRLIRQMLTEYVLLAGLGSGLGLLVALGCLKAFLVLNPLTRSRLDEASLDPASLGFAMLATLVTSALFGLWPALQASRPDLRQSIQESGRSGAGPFRQHARIWLVATEVALALVLLTTAGLMVRSFVRVLAVDPGFQFDSVLAFDVDSPSDKYPGSSGKAAFFRQLTEHLQALPGVRAAGAVSCLPLGGGENMGEFVVEGASPDIPSNKPNAERRWVTPGYFAAMGVPLRQGRVFTEQDVAGHPEVAVIGETLAKEFFNTGDALGHRIQVSGQWRTVVGVVSDVKSTSLEGAVRPQIYLPHAQDPWPPMTLVLHTEGNPMALASAARRELKQLDAQVPAAKMRTMAQVVAHASSSRRFNMVLLAFFAGGALLLTIIGIYGVVAYLANHRRWELGIRMALGAQRGDVLKLVLQQGMKPVIAGCGAGLVASLAASRLIANQLYGISTFDPATLAGIVLVVVIASLLACWLPARRAARIDPMSALRLK